VIAGLLNGREELDEAIEECREGADGEPGTDELFDAVEDEATSNRMKSQAQAMSLIPYRLPYTTL
jgi:hypothetical protein